jgi:hypothetical protein
LIYELIALSIPQKKNSSRSYWWHTKIRYFR